MCRLITGGDDRKKEKTLLLQGFPATLLALTEPRCLQVNPLGSCTWGWGGTGRAVSSA